MSAGGSWLKKTQWVFLLYRYKHSFFYLVGDFSFFFWCRRRLIEFFESIATKRRPLLFRRRNRKANLRKQLGRKRRRWKKNKTHPFPLAVSVRLKHTSVNFVKNNELCWEEMSQTSRIVKWHRGISTWRIPPHLETFQFSRRYLKHWHTLPPESLGEGERLAASARLFILTHKVCSALLQANGGKTKTRLWNLNEFEFYFPWKRSDVAQQQNWASDVFKLSFRLANGHQSELSLVYEVANCSNLRSDLTYISVTNGTSEIFVCWLKICTSPTQRPCWGN